jgi:hypothetical protein
MYRALTTVYGRRHIEETGKSLAVGLREHRRNFEGRLERSRLAERVVRRGSSNNAESSECLTHGKNVHVEIIKERSTCLI